MVKSLKALLTIVLERVVHSSKRSVALGQRWCLSDVLEREECMRRALILALVSSAFAAAPMAPAHAALVLVGTFSGNQCGGGPITTCFANGTVAGSGTLTQVG